MIYDDFTHIGRYRGLHPNIDLALDYLAQTDLKKLDLGRHDVADSAVFLLVQDNTLNDIVTDRFEYHQKYMDIQFLLAGHENFRYSRQHQGHIQAFDSETDIGFVSCQTAYDLALTPETFVMIWPGEYHQPNQLGTSGTQVRKCVLKILID